VAALTQVKRRGAGDGSIGERRGGTTMQWETAGVVAALALALAFRPWQMLREPALRHPWLAALVLLPWLWSTDARLPGGLPLQLSLAALMVLMFGWPLAAVTAVAVAGLAAWLADPALADGVDAWWRLTAHVALWSGVLSATFGLVIGLATRRWLPRHLMVYILARGFFATLLAMTATGALWVATQPAPPGSDAQLLMVGRWLIAWGDAVTTGMLTAVFVAFRPEWLATYSDRRYLPSR
jgi:uncharacterized membrane protein